MLPQTSALLDPSLPWMPYKHPPRRPARHWQTVFSAGTGSFDNAPPLQSSPEVNDQITNLCRDSTEQAHAEMFSCLWNGMPFTLTMHTRLQNTELSCHKPHQQFTALTFLKGALLSRGKCLELLVSMRPASFLHGFFKQIEVL